MIPICTDGRVWALTISKREKKSQLIASLVCTIWLFDYTALIKVKMRFVSKIFIVRRFTDEAIIADEEYESMEEKWR